MKFPQNFPSRVVGPLKRRGTQKAPCGAWHVTLELRLVGYLSYLLAQPQRCGPAIGTYYHSSLAGRLCSAQSEILYLIITWR
jgi:hypothetical protein